MKNILKSMSAGLLMLCLFTACEDGFKSYANDNTARPTLPDGNDRNIGADGTSDKLIDPFYKGPKKWNGTHQDDTKEQTAIK